MKNIIAFSVIVFAFFAISCSSSTEESGVNTDIVQNPNTANGTADTTNLPKFKFETLNYDFGVMVQGEKVSYTYKYKNIGGSDLIISNVKASCGCTVPKWNKEPLKPGAVGELELVFDSAGKRGIQHKTVTILANTQPNTVKLGFTAEVIVPGS